MIYLGNNKVGTIYSGADKVDKIYRGEELVYSSGPAVDNDFVFTVDSRRGSVWQKDYLLNFGWNGSFTLEIVGTGVVKNYSGTGSINAQSDGIKFPGAGTYQVRISGQYNYLQFGGRYSFGSSVVSIDN